MGGYHPVDERHEAFPYHIRLGIREGIENESIRLHVAEHVAEIVLEQAASAAAEGKQLYARIAAELGRVGHSGAGCAGAVRVAGTPDGHAMTERILYGLYRGALFHTYPDGILLAVEREVEQALVHTAVHIAYERERLVQLLVRRHSGGSEEPLTVLANVEVIAPGGKAVGIGRETELAIFGHYPQGFGVGPEHAGHTGSHPDLEVLGRGEALVAQRIHPVIRISRLSRHQLADEGEVRGLGIDISLGSGREAECHRSKKDR